MRQNDIWVSGRKIVLEALQRIPEQVLKIKIPRGSTGAIIDEIVTAAKTAGVDVEFTLKDKSLGLAGLIRQKKNMSAAELLEKKQGFFVAADGVYDPHNLGALIRSAYSFSADAVIVPEKGSCGVTEAMIRCSAGAALYCPVVFSRNFSQIIATLAKNEYEIIGTSAEDGVALSDFESDCQKTVLVIGNEDTGIKSAVKKNCTGYVRIEMNHMESLNMSVAAGIIMYRFSLLRSRAESK